MFTFTPFFHSEEKGHSKKLVHELKLFQKVKDYNGNWYTSPQKELEFTWGHPTVVLSETLGGGMGSEGDGFPLTGFFLCT